MSVQEKTSHAMSNKDKRMSALIEIIHGVAFKRLNDFQLQT